MTQDAAERAYVERIEIRGNTRTRDYVIRREFDLSEGDAFNQTMMVGPEYTAWVENEEKRHRALMKDAGFLAATQ